MMNGKEAKGNLKINLLIRHKEINPIHNTSNNYREQDGVGLHFRSIMLDSAYNKRIKNFTVCIFDDYLN